jgi:thioester reductase-like protein
MATIFFTGFPGFLGSELLWRVLERSPAATGLCLVQPKFEDLARRRAAELEAAHPGVKGRIAIALGDITAPGLGLAPGAAEDVTEIFHLAAVYDLSVTRELAMKVNVDGTRHTLDFAAACPRLERFHYVSTCYVSGRYDGTFTEADLVKGQTFQNFYEETKYLAEVDVQERMKAGLPVTIYRPGIVVGDSHTGATQKFDGPYYVIRWLLKQPAFLAFLPVPGNPKNYVVNVIPRDYVLDALLHLSGLPQSKGKVYQLAEPNPLTVDEILRVTAQATGRRVLRIPLPKGLAKWSLRSVPGVFRLMQIPAASVDYFVHPTRYTSDNTQADLAGSGITAPPFASYAPHLAAFVRANPDIESKAMV